MNTSGHISFIKVLASGIYDVADSHTHAKRARSGFENSCNATHRARRHLSATATIELWDAQSLTEPLSICSYDQVVHTADESHSLLIYLRRAAASWRLPGV